MSRAKAPLFANDKLLARRSGPWAKDKLYYVHRYQTIFATGMKNKWPHRTYLDLMAGPGICRIEDSGEEFDGSALLSLKADFTKRIFVEKDPAAAAALEQRTSDQNRDVIPGDANSFGIINRMRDATEGTLGLAFVDNEGLDIPFATLAKLIEGRSIDLLITVMLADIRRNVQDAIGGGPHRARFDAFMGGPDWLSAVRPLLETNARATEMADAFIAEYFKQFAKLGHRHADQINYEMRNSTNATQYRLALVSADAKAVEFLRSIATIDPQGQRTSLLD